MISAITSIKIYNPVGALYYSDKDRTSVDFPITDQCERSAKLMGEDYVHLVFNLENKVTFDAFSFIRYNGQTFFLREQYTPTPNGTIQENGGGISSAYYTYDLKFVSVANMLDKHVCYRHVKVSGDKGGEWYEPEININGVLDTLYVIVLGAINRAAIQHSDIYYGQLLSTIYENGLAADGISPNHNKVKLTKGTTLRTFNFSGDSISNVCTTIANTYTEEDKRDTEWYITEEYNQQLDTSTLILHMDKCTSDEIEQVFTDYVKEDVGSYAFAHPYVSGGLKKVEYAQEWSGVPQVIVPYGSDRNMSGRSVKGIDDITSMQSTFGKRLRLTPNTSYNIVIGRDENDIPIMGTITTDENGALENNLVSTGIEQVKFFDEVYPQGHFRVSNVTGRMLRRDGEYIPEYTIEALPIDTNGNLIEKADLTKNGFYPIDIEEGTTLSVRFEKGLLNGREFEIANKTRKDEGATTYSMKFTIISDGSIEDGTLIPSGFFKPNVGDEFALFNMKMPDVYIDQAERELAQKAYEELVRVQTTRPEVKCSSDPTNFNGNIELGNVVSIHSELFNAEGNAFKSRVISYSHKLTTTTDVQFSLASAVMQGTLTNMNDAIADVTSTTSGLEQRTINLSRRAWRDASEAAEMLDIIQKEMMLIGEAKYQFSFTSAIECEHDASGFTGLKIGYGSLQHTQEPYINYANKGWWEVSAQTINIDETTASLDKDTPYYLYAKAQDVVPSVADMILSTTQYDRFVDVDSPKSDDAYLLIGILSSEFEGKRVFSRTNGFTAIEGGTITTEQIQDAGRNLIIDFQSDPPRIIARNKARIEGNIKLTLTQEQINDIVNDLPPIGGKNLLSKTAIHFNYVAASYVGMTKLYNLDAGKKYIATYGKFENNASGQAGGAFDGVCLGIGRAHSFLSMEKILRFGESFEVNNNGRELYLLWCNYRYAQYMLGKDDQSGSETLSEFTQYLDEVMLQEGSVSTSFQPYVEHLVNALEGSTEISGGLTMTNVLALKDETNKITGGMSGLSNDNILMWGGGSYRDAVQMALKENYDIRTDKPITFLRKDGTGKVGIFKIGSDKADVQVPNGGFISIKAGGTTESGIFIANNKEIKVIVTDLGIDDVATRMQKYKDYMEIDYSEVELAKDELGYFVSTLPYHSSGVPYGVQLNIKCKFYDIPSDVTLGVDKKYIAECFSFVNTDKETALWSDVIKTLFTIEDIKDGVYECEFNMLYNERFDLAGNLRSLKLQLNNTLGFSKCDISVSGYIRLTEVVTLSPNSLIIGNDGINCSTEESCFKVQNGLDGQRVYVKGLGSQKGTDGSGELYVTNIHNDGLIKTLYDGFAKISEVLEKCRYEGSNDKAQAEAKQACDDIRTQLSNISIIANS